MTAIADVHAPVEAPADLPSPDTPRRRQAPRRSLATQAGAIAVCAIGAWFALYAVVLTGTSEGSTQTRLYASLRAEFAAATAPLGPPIARGMPLAVIDAPAAGLHNTVVVEGTGAADTAKGPGHLASTPLPGQAGASVIYGRSLTYGAPFAHIRQLRPGAMIRVITQQAAFTFRVLDVRQPGSPLPKPLAAGGARLVLVSSAGANWRSGWAPDHAVYVDADLVAGQVQPDAGAPPLAASSDLPMHVDTSSLVSLVLWLQLTLVVAAGAGWAWLHWGRWQTWLVGVPLLLGALWGATGAATLLLPNLV